MKFQPSAFEEGATDISQLECVSCACPIGNACSPNEEDKNNECTPCQPGKFASIIGQRECELCEPGKISSTDGTAVCKLCASGQVPNDDRTS